MRASDRLKHPGKKLPCVLVLVRLCLCGVDGCKWKALGTHTGWPLKGNMHGRARAEEREPATSKLQ